MRRLDWLAGTAVAALLAAVPARAETPLDMAAVEEVVVTGERVARTLKETAASVAVTTGEELERQAASDRVEQVLQLVPNIQLGAGDQGPSIRGQESTGVLQGADAFLGGTRPRATLTVDGRSLGYNEFIYGLASVWDVERVEVFRGPQTTTQGRNSIAGAIFVQTRDPTFTPEGRARLIVGNYQTRQASAALSGPLLDDQVAARVAVDLRDHRSWVNYTGGDRIVGANRRDDDYGVGRAKLLVRPSGIPDLTLRLTYSHLESSNPQGEAVEAPFRDRSYSNPDGGYWKTDVDSGTAALEYLLSDALDFGVTAAYGDSAIDRLSNPGNGNARVDAEDLSVEALMRWRAGPDFRGIVGASGLWTDQDEVIDLSAFLGFGDFRDEQRSRGLFGEATWQATERLSLTAGARWQRDTQDRQGSLGLCNPDVVCFRVDYDRSFEEFLPKFDAGFDLTPDTRIGLLAQKGFNPGGTTISFETGAQDGFGEETLWSYEAYLRSSVTEDFAVTANLFHTDIKDAQRPLTRVLTRPDGTRAFETQIDNAPSAYSYGIEAEIAWTVTDGLELKAGLGLLESEIDGTLDREDPIRGRDFQRAPKLSAAAAVGWQPLEQVRLDLQARHNGDYFSDDANTRSLRIQGSTVLDAQISYEFGDARLFAYARNALDEDYLSQLYAPDFGTAGDPREFGIGVEARF